MILQGVEFPVFLLILSWALQQCSATVLPSLPMIRQLNAAKRRVPVKLFKLGVRTTASLFLVAWYAAGIWKLMQSGRQNALFSVHVYDVHFILGVLVRWVI